MDEQERIEFGHEIRAMRRGQKLTQQELADMAKVSRKTIVNLESGKVEPQAGNLAHILEALNYKGQGERPWDDEVEAFLQMLGFRLAKLPPDQRIALIDQMTRVAIYGSPAQSS